jgi:hypothetical protein
MVKIQLEELAEGINIGDKMSVTIGKEVINYIVKKIENWEILTEQGEDGYSVLSIEKI